MSSSDAIVLQAHFSDWKSRTVGLDDIDPWVYYCISQFVKAYDLNDEEILYGITDGGGDGGADSYFCIVNHRVLDTDSVKIDTKGVTSIRLVFFQIKTSGGFRPTEIEKHIELSDDFFDLSKNPEDLSFRYSDIIINRMRRFRDLFLKTTSNSASLFVDFYYITGDDAQVDSYSTDSMERVKAKVTHHLSKAKVTYSCIGAEQLWEQAQKRPPKEKTITWVGQPMDSADGVVGLVKLVDYYKFLEDEPGILAERIFESNVRGYQKTSSVNNEISASLEDKSSNVNFWLLNNGITIIASDTASAGYLSLSITDPQIVNGLQTSRVIYNFLSEVKKNDKDRYDVEDRSVLIRVVVIKDATVKDLVIKSTNSQTRMASASLRMTDQVHRDIEELFKKYDLFYDRRKGFYADSNVPIKKIVSVNLLAQSVISVMLQRPDDARARPGDYFTKDAKYKSIFENSKIGLPIYLKCFKLIQHVESYLSSRKTKSSDAKNLRFYIAMVLSTELTKIQKPYPDKITNLPDPMPIDDALMQSCFDRVNAIYEQLSKDSDRDAVARGSEMLAKVLDDVRIRFPYVKKGAQQDLLEIDAT